MVTSTPPAPVNKVLNATKELLGVPLEVTVFDSVLVLHINSVLSTLDQLISGQDEPYQITLTDGDLEDMFPDDETVRSLVQMYIFCKVRLLFDPPISSFVLTALQAQIAEFEGRLLDYKVA